MIIHGVELIERDDMVCLHQLRSGKSFEAESMAAWLEACESGAVVLDIGAYTGLFAIAAAKAGAHAIAFEPNNAVYRRLLQNVSVNGHPVEAHNAAVSDSIGTVGMITNPSVRLTSGGRVCPHGRIAATTIDQLDLSTLTAIKIDVEGHEQAVIKGGLETIKVHKPLIITEALTRDALDEQAAILGPLGYHANPADEHNIIWSL